MRTSERGFAYLLLLFGLAIGGVALAAAGERWQVTLQREREADLIFRGLALRTALLEHAARAQDGASRYPERLEDLLISRPSQPAVAPPLRRLYTDPFTGRADWLPLRGPDGGIVGVASRSRTPALARPPAPVALRLSGDPATSVTVGDWRFMAEPAVDEGEPT